MKEFINSKIKEIRDLDEVKIVGKIFEEKKYNKEQFEYLYLLCDTSIRGYVSQLDQKVHMMKFANDIHTCTLIKKFLKDERILEKLELIEEYQKKEKISNKIISSLSQQDNNIDVKALCDTYLKSSTKDFNDSIELLKSSITKNELAIEEIYSKKSLEQKYNKKLDNDKIFTKKLDSLTKELSTFRKDFFSNLENQTLISNNLDKKNVEFDNSLNELIKKFKEEISIVKNKYEEVLKKIFEQNNKLDQQAKIITEQNKTISKQQNQIDEISKKHEQLENYLNVINKKIINDKDSNTDEKLRYMIHQYFQKLQQPTPAMMYSQPNINYHNPFVYQ